MALKKRPIPRKDIKQPVIPMPSQPDYHGQDLASLLDNRENKVDMNWLEQVGANMPGGINNGMGGFSTKPNNNPNNSKNGQNDMHSTYADLLNNNSQNGFADFLASLGIQQQTGLNGFQRDDWNKQLLDTMLNYYMELEKRNYNEQWWNTQNLYNSPTNQLARLMGAGISRNAAIQLLSASGGSGSGAATPYTEGAAAAEGIPASQSTLNQVQSVTSVFGTIANVAGAIGSLGTFGLSAASLGTNLAATRAMTAGQILSNTQLSKTLNGIEAASTVIGALSSAYQAGVIPPDHNFESSQDMIKYISDNSDKYEPFKSLVDSGALKGIVNDIYSLDALNHGYSSWRKSRDYGIDRKHYVTMYALDELFKQTDINEVNTEIALNNQKINESIANVINSTKIANAQNVLMHSQASYFDKQSDVIGQQFDMQQMDLDFLTASIDDINSIRMNQLFLDASRWNALRDDPVVWNAEVTSWLEDKQNLRTAIAIESYYYANRSNAIQAMQTPGVPLSDKAFAQTAVWFHNLFSNTPLNRPGGPATQRERDYLGALSASEIGLWALRKYAHIP